MLKSDQPEKKRKIYVIPKESKKRIAAKANGTYKPKPKTKIKSRSDKREREYKIYREKIRPEVLAKNPYCKVCGQPATELHHKGGKVGKLLIKKSNLLPVCRPCHNKIGENHQWALANGYSIDSTTL